VIILAILRYRNFNNLSELLSSKPRQTKYQKKEGSRLDLLEPSRGDISPLEYLAANKGV